MYTWGKGQVPLLWTFTIGATAPFIERKKPKMPQGKNGKSDTNDEKPLSVAELVGFEKEARGEWYAHFGGGAPVKPYTTEQSASLRKLEKAKQALIAATGASNFKDAALKADYKPVYAPRTRKEKVETKA